LKARTLTFYVDEVQLVDVLARIDGELVPAYRESAHFVGIVVLRSPELHGRVLGISVWDDDVPGCEDVVAKFREDLASRTGASPAAATYDVLRLISIGQVSS
jgi:hypothetical protein